MIQNTCDNAKTYGVGSIARKNGDIAINAADRDFVASLCHKYRSKAEKIAIESRFHESITIFFDFLAMIFCWRRFIAIFPGLSPENAEKVAMIWDFSGFIAILTDVPAYIASFFSSQSWSVPEASDSFFSWSWIAVKSGISSGLMVPSTVMSIRRSLLL